MIIVSNAMRSSDGGQEQSWELNKAAARGGGRWMMRESAKFFKVWVGRTD
jgi:hypothetical protein